MAIKRLYVHRDRVDETVDALAERLSGEVVGDGLADGVTMGPVHTAGARDRVEAMVAEAAAAGAAVLRPGTAAGRGRGLGRLLRLAGHSWSRPGRSSASSARSSSRRRCR